MNHDPVIEHYICCHSDANTGGQESGQLPFAALAARAAGAHRTATVKVTVRVEAPPGRLRCHGHRASDSELKFVATAQSTSARSHGVGFD